MTNDVLVYGACVAGAVSCVVAFALYHIYGGVQGNLSSAKVGEVYNFEYLQPVTEDPKRFLVRVTNIAQLTDEQIRRLDKKSAYRRHDADFLRTRHLVTGQSFDGKIRNFYAERVVNCRRPLLGPAVFKAGLAHLFF